MKRGALDVDAENPLTMLAHAPGYIDRDNEVVVGLQTDKPFRSRTPVTSRDMRHPLAHEGQQTQR